MKNAGVSLLVVAMALAMTFTVAAAQNSSPPAGAKTFPTPQQGADALIAAAQAGDVAAIGALFGPDGRNLVVTGDTVQDKIRLDEFAAMARERRDVAVDPKNANRAIISVGADLWPLPIPLVRHGGRWSFDAASGRAEILYRRIGSNELDTIQVCRGFVEAQFEYR